MLAAELTGVVGFEGAAGCWIAVWVMSRVLFVSLNSITLFSPSTDAVSLNVPDVGSSASPQTSSGGRAIWA